MSTFNSFIPENCIGRKFRWTRFDEWNGNKVFKGVVDRADNGDDGALYTKDGKYFRMKELELGDAMLEWLD
jgi:hypothetical protein